MRTPAPLALLCVAAVLVLPASAWASAAEPPPTQAMPAGDPSPTPPDPSPPAGATGFGDDGGRPTVALVLSGGGARGAAHVGVLRALEEMRVPVDLVVGTSMGAVVGGLYACGLSPDELERVLVEVDWTAAFEDRPARRDRSFRRKEDDRRFLFDLELNVGGDAPTLPSGFRSGQNLLQILRRLTLRCTEVRDFDRLGIPFRAVATDLERQEKVVLAEGDLVTAMRASMAIPGFFSPLRSDDGRLLVDGGVVQNLPVETARELGADVVVAVDVTTPPRSGDGSLVSVTSRTLDLLVNTNVVESRRRADVLLAPELGDANLFSFAVAPRLVDRGEEEVAVHAAELVPLALPAAEHRRLLERQRRPEPAALPAVDVLVVEGTRRVHPDQLTDRIRTRPGQPLDPDRLAEDVARLYGLGEFAWVDARYERQDGVGTLVIDSREKPRGAFVARFGLSLDGALGDDASFGILTSLLATQLNPRGAEWRTDLQVGDLRLLATELYQPLDFPGRFFVAPHLGFRQEAQDFFDGGRRVAEYEVDSAVAGLDLGRALGKHGELRVGLLRGRVEAKVDTGARTLPEAEDDLAGLHVRLALDRLDNPVFPRSGTSLVVESFLAQPDLGSDVDYRSLVGAAGLFHTHGVHTVFAGVEGGWTWGGDLPVYDLFAIGGLLSLSGYDDRELRGNHYGVARVGYYQRLLDLPPALGGAVYFGGWLEAGNAWQGSGDVSFSDLRYAATAGLGVDTLAGPVLAAWGQGEDGGKLYLTLGRTF